MEKVRDGKGYHLIIDGVECDYNKISDNHFIYEFLDKYPTEINMNKVSPPYVNRYYMNDIEMIFGFVMIAESHISIHANLATSEMNLDIYSCKEFDIDKAIKDIIHLFGIKKSKIKVLIRGQEVPRFIKIADNLSAHLNETGTFIL
ncbi:MAG: S-adenosylmethionine decarboxylase [Candidatus Desulfofervidus auxilii]|nr:S-adenosylmethionine decarboxylase [Candidatus Desulfofervidus auxilii]